MKNEIKHGGYKDISKEELFNKVALLESEIQSLEVKTKAIIISYEDKLKEAALQYDHLLEQILLAKRSRFASSSEKSAQEQMSIFDEAELFSEFEEVEVTNETNPKVTESKRKPKSKKFTLDESTLRVEEIIHDLEDEEKIGYKPMGQTSKRLLVFQPAEWYLEEHIYPKYVKELEDGSSSIISASPN